MSLSDVGNHDLIDELELRGYVVIDLDDYKAVVNQIKEWRGEKEMLK